MSVDSVLFLGAGHQQLAAIRYAQRAGYRVVTCDNRPGNPGHALADRSHDVSTTDADGVLEVARAEAVDAVVCFASDAGTVAAAHVAEQLGLAGNPLASVRTLSDKARFRNFQRENGFFTPQVVEVGPDGLADADVPFAGPFIVKPVDASGSSGVGRVRGTEELEGAIADALSFSRSGRSLVEELVPSVGLQVCGDGFLVDGEIAFHAFGNEHFSRTKVPVGESFPAELDGKLENAAVAVLQSMFERLEMRTGAFNADLLFTETGDVFVVEIGPRAGGNRIPEAVFHATGFDEVGAVVEAALGGEVELGRHETRPHATYSLFAMEDGGFAGVDYSPEIEERVVDEQLFVAPGDSVRPFDRGAEMVGALILRFDGADEMVAMMDSMDSRVEVRLDRP